MKKLLIIGNIFFLRVLEASDQSFWKAMIWKKDALAKQFYSSPFSKNVLEPFKNALKERWNVILTTPRTLQILAQNPSIEAYYEKKKEKYEKQENCFINAITGEGVASDVRSVAEIVVQEITGNFSYHKEPLVSEVKLPLGIEEKIKRLGGAHKLPIVVKAEKFTLFPASQGMSAVDMIARASGANELLIYPSFFKLNSGEQKFFSSHEIEHLINRDCITVMLVINHEVCKKTGRYIQDLSSDEVQEIIPTIKGSFKPQLLAWQILQEKRADKLAASKDMEGAQAASKLFYRLPQIEVPNDPHPKHIKRAAYLAKIYNLLKAEETIKATANRILQAEPF